MAIKYTPEVEQPGAPPLKTNPRRSDGGWFRRLQRRVKLALAGNDDELRVENKTAISWRVYHNYHQLGIIDAHEQRIFQLNKHGSLSVRPYADGDDVEYLMLDLSIRIHRVYIYRRRMSREIEIYDQGLTVIWRLAAQQECNRVGEWSWRFWWKACHATCALLQ